jgi:hypothetical protein
MDVAGAPLGEMRLPSGAPPLDSTKGRRETAVTRLFFSF